MRLMDEEVEGMVVEVEGTVEEVEVELVLPLLDLEIVAALIP